jgi:anti-anti-sigma factor
VLADTAFDPPKLDIRVEMRDPETAGVTVVGDVDVSTAQQLEAALMDLVRQGVQYIRIDAAGIVFMDSTGLRSLVNVIRARRDVRLIVQSARPALRNLLRVTSVDSMVQFE